VRGGLGGWRLEGSLSCDKVCCPRRGRNECCCCPLLIPAPPPDQPATHRGAPARTLPPCPSAPYPPSACLGRGGTAWRGGGAGWGHCASECQAVGFLLCSHQSSPYEAAAHTQAAARCNAHLISSPPNPQPMSANRTTWSPAGCALPSPPPLVDASAPFLMRSGKWSLLMVVYDGVCVCVGGCVCVEACVYTWASHVEACERVYNQVPNAPPSSSTPHMHPLASSSAAHQSISSGCAGTS